jgi:hypothetical protein
VTDLTAGQQHSSRLTTPHQRTARQRRTAPDRQIGWPRAPSACRQGRVRGRESSGPRTTALARGSTAAPPAAPAPACPPCWHDSHVFTSHDRCPACGRRIEIYDSTACEDEGGQTWCTAHLPDDHPQTSLNMHLTDGRNITIDEIKIGESTAGWLVGSAQRIWDDVVHESATPLTDGGGELPTFVIPPVSRRSDIPVLPRWKVHARLTSEPMAALSSITLGDGSSITLGGGSHLMLVFFSNDIASRPITALIGDRLAHVDEKTWREHARDFEN